MLSKGIGNRIFVAVYRFFSLLLIRNPSAFIEVLSTSRPALGEREHVPLVEVGERGPPWVAAVAGNLLKIESCRWAS